MTTYLSNCIFDTHFQNSQLCWILFYIAKSRMFIVTSDPFLILYVFYWFLMKIENCWSVMKYNTCIILHNTNEHMKCIIVILKFIRKWDTCNCMVIALNTDICISFLCLLFCQGR